jgi:RHS repeat-associated protein
VWCGNHICEERDASGTNITKRFYPQGVALETGPTAGAYYYTRDHLGSVRELTDGAGNVRARYSYDPFGRRTKVSGDLDDDFGFAGMFWSPEVNLAFTHFRAYDPDQGRWLSRDPLPNAEIRQGPNLYAYVGNEPVKRTDPMGLGPTAPSGALSVGVAIGSFCEFHPDECGQALEDLELAGNQAAQQGQAIVQSCGNTLQTGGEALLETAESGGGALNRVLDSLGQFPDPIENSLTRMTTLPGIRPDTIADEIEEVTESDIIKANDVFVDFDKGGWVVRSLNYWVNRMDWEEFHDYGRKIEALADFIFDY